MNLHHLELFYYVAKAGGINRACRIIPYGIQQPAVSSQILKLEKELGLSLFRRKPFQLTEAGQRLYDFLHPFFHGLIEVEAVLKGTTTSALRLAGVGEFLKDHLPELLGAVQKKFPNLRAQVYERNQAESMAMLEKGEADLAITVRESFLPPSIQLREVAKLPMVLLVGPSHRKVKKAQDFLTGRVEAPLIALPANEVLTREFTQELIRRQGNWPVTLEASGMELIAQYVARDMGIGLAVQIPQARLPKGVQALPLDGFPKIVIGAFWRGKLGPPAQLFLEMLLERARNL